MKLGLLAAGLVLVAGGAVGCGSDDSGDGGGGGEDKAATKTEFCAAFQGFYDDLDGLDENADNLGELLKAAADELEDVGTPEDIPADAKKGLEQTLEQIDSLPDDATSDDIDALDTESDEEAQANSKAFSTYLDTTCPDIGA